MNLPLNIFEGQVSVFRSGWSAVIQTSFGLRVTFDWNSFATVTVPSTYMGAVFGLCGNYNGNPEDDLIVRGTTIPASGPDGVRCQLECRRDHRLCPWLHRQLSGLRPDQKECL